MKGLLSKGLKDQVWVSLFALLFLSAAMLGIKEFTTDFVRLWDFTVYLKAKAHYAVIGNPYFEAESLRFIYPPSALFFLYLIQDNETFKSLYFVFNGMLWVSIASFFCRSPKDLFFIIPAFFILFGMQGWVTILTGNIACILYFTAALFCYLYFKGQLSNIVFCMGIFVLTLIKPFYAEFLIFIWFIKDFKTFLIASICVVAGFFAVNILFYPELFQFFLNALKVDSYDTEIFGITFFSFLSGLGVHNVLAIGAHFMLIGILLLMVFFRYASLDQDARFACIFILAVFINPKHISYDLLVAVPPLAALLLYSNKRVLLIGSAFLLLISFISFGLDSTPYFLWWHGYLAVLFMVLFSGRIYFQNPLRFNQTENG